jgi:hypothetical protein
VTKGPIKLVFLSVAIGPMAVALTAGWILPRGNTGMVDHQAQPAEKVFKNIQVLKDTSANEIQGAMEFMSASLGVSCGYCHANSWDSDEKPAKTSARAMMQMTRDLNKTGFSGYDVVNCYTCHRGHVQPASVPGSGEAAGDEAPADSGRTGPSEPLPATELVLQKYFEALGGEHRISELRSLVCEGTRFTDGPEMSKVTERVEISLQAPDKYLVKVQRSGGPTYSGFAGPVGWLRDAAGSRRLDGDDLARLRADAEFYQYLKLKDTFPRMAVLGREIVSGREAYLVGAATSDGQRVRLYFDTKDGLLLRKVVTRKTVLGTLLLTTDFEDYKSVGGLKLPFKMIYVRPPTRVTQEFTVIKPNIEIDPATFQAP